MTPTELPCPPKPPVHLEGELARRYHAWAKIPSNGENHVPRLRAWCAYCDARDNLPDGSTAAHDRKLNADPRQSEADSQLELFRAGPRKGQPFIPPAPINGNGPGAL